MGTFLRISLIALLALVFARTDSFANYKCVDESGQLHYSDSLAGLPKNCNKMDEGTDEPSTSADKPKKGFQKSGKLSSLAYSDCIIYTGGEYKGNVDLTVSGAFLSDKNGKEAAAKKMRIRFPGYEQSYPVLGSLDGKSEIELSFYTEGANLSKAPSKIEVLWQSSGGLKKLKTVKCRKADKVEADQYDAIESFEDLHHPFEEAGRLAVEKHLAERGEEFPLVPVVIGSSLLLLTLFGMLAAFAKAGQPGWAAFIPVYNLYVMLKIARRPGWWVILFFVPLINILVSIMVPIDIARNFRKGSGFGLGLAFLPFIFYPILGFGDSRYRLKKKKQ